MHGASGSGGFCNATSCHQDEGARIVSTIDFARRPQRAIRHARAKADRSPGSLRFRLAWDTAGVMAIKVFSPGPGVRALLGRHVGAGAFGGGGHVWLPLASGAKDRRLSCQGRVGLEPGAP